VQENFVMFPTLFSPIIWGGGVVAPSPKDGMLPNTEARDKMPQDLRVTARKAK
jgi:hypothetical protein